MAKKRKVRRVKPGTAGAGNGGIIPPIDTRFPPGVSGNPDGRPSVGASAKEWMNALNYSVRNGELDEDDLRKIAKGKKIEPAKRTAATRLLRMIEAPDPADYSLLCDGEETLEQARARGVNTEPIKKVKTRKTYDDKGNHVGTEREVEILDRSGAEFDRAMNRTDGLPTQTIVSKNDGSIKDPIDGAAEAARLIARISECLGAAARDPARNQAAR